MGTVSNITKYSNRHNLEHSHKNPHYTDDSGGGNDGGDGMLEARVAKLESDVNYIRRDVDEIKADIKSLSNNMTQALGKLESIKETLSTKPSADAVDKKIADAKLAVLLGVPAIIAIGTGIYKALQHYF